MNFKDALEPFKLAARYILADTDRAEQLLGLMTDKEGAMTAVHAVIAGIDQKKKIPPEIAPFLGLYVLAKLLDMNKKANQVEIQKPMVDEIIQMVLEDISKIIPVGGQQANPTAPQAPTPPAPKAPQTGLINQGAPA